MCVFVCVCVCSFLNAYTDWCVFASVRARWLPRVWADHSSIAHSPQQTTWGSSAPLKPSPPTLSCSKRPHLTSGRRCFPCCCCFPMTLLLKQRIQTWPPGSAGRHYRRTLYDLMKGISTAFWSLSDVCFREPPSPCWRQCSLKSLLLFVCWKHNAKANDVKLKAWMSDLEGQAETWWLLCCIALCYTEDVFSLCACLWIVVHCHTSLYTLQWWNERRITLSQCSYSSFLLWIKDSEISLTSRISHSSSPTDRHFTPTTFRRLRPHQALLTQGLLACVNTGAWILD